MNAFFYELKRNRNLLIGIIMVASVALVALLSDIISPYAYNYADTTLKYQPPGSVFLWGTDELGRDVFSRVLFGSRIALRIAIMGVAIQTFLGVTFGLLAGYFGRIVDRTVSFLADLTWSMPPIIMSMAVITILGRGLDNTIIAISVVSWAQYTRLVRAKTQSLKTMAFVETAVAFNESHFSILTRYILPNTLPSIIVLSSLSIPQIILSTTALSFLGLGAQPPSPDWGLALSNSFRQIATAPWLSIYPGLALVYTVFGFNLLGEGVRDYLDPRLRSL